MLNRHLQATALVIVLFKEFTGHRTQEVWGTEVPSEVQGRNPDRDSGEEVPQKLVVFCVTKVAYEM